MPTSKNPTKSVVANINPKACPLMPRTSRRNPQKIRVVKRRNPRNLLKIWWLKRRSLLQTKTVRNISQKPKSSQAIPKPLSSNIPILTVSHVSQVTPVEFFGFIVRKRWGNVNIPTKLPQRYLVVPDQSCRSPKEYGVYVCVQIAQSLLQFATASINAVSLVEATQNSLTSTPPTHPLLCSLVFRRCNFYFSLV